MKKIVMLIVCLFIASSFAYARQGHSLPHALIQQGTGMDATVPYTVIVPVRYGAAGADDVTLVSGTVVSWDGLSLDGVTVVKRLATNGATTTLQSSSYIGVLVTDLLTDEDSNNVGTIDNPSGRNWGYMAIEGYCLASIDAAMGAGQVLIPSLTLHGALGAMTDATASREVGIVLDDVTAAGVKARVILQQRR